MDFEEVMQALEDANFSNLNIDYMGTGTKPNPRRSVSDWLTDVEIYSSNPNDKVFSLIWDSDSQSFAVACAGQILNDMFTTIPCYPDDSYSAVLTNECRILVEYLNNTIPQAEEFTDAVKPFL